MADARTQWTLGAKDYILSTEGLCFSVLSDWLEEGRYPCMLRYCLPHCVTHFNPDNRLCRGRWIKLPTTPAWELLHEQFAHYIYQSHRWDVRLQGVTANQIAETFCKHAKTQQLLAEPTKNLIERKAQWFLKRLVDEGIASETLGVTGSLLVGAHKEESDIDLVITDYAAFQRAREVIGRIHQETPPPDSFWKETHRRRGSALALEEYIRAEAGKHNKLNCDGTKIDISLVEACSPESTEPFQKLSHVSLQATIVEDRWAWNQPAVWKIDSPEASRIVCWTATYTGQAKRGQRVEVVGWLEEGAKTGIRQIVVGSSREAPGELIRVLG